MLGFLMEGHNLVNLSSINLFSGMATQTKHTWNECSKILQPKVLLLMIMEVDYKNYNFNTNCCVHYIISHYCVVMKGVNSR